MILGTLAVRGQTSGGGTAAASQQPDSQMRCDRVSCVMTSGEWAMFTRERPPLSYVELETPITVRKLKGTIYSTDKKPLGEAKFEIRRPDGTVAGATTDSGGSFEFASPHGALGKLFKVGPGTYRFKATMDGFHSTVGTVVVSKSAPKESSIVIELQPGK